MKKLSLLLICLCTLLQAIAQYNSNRNKVWIFGDSVGVDFTSGTPIPFTSSINVREGCAFICDINGSLLFYTDGRIVYNRLGVAMPYGSAIVPFFTSSTTQGALIVPFINNSNKYYVFSIEQHGGSGRLAYSIVDMTLDGGLGEIIPGSAGTIIDTGMSEKMISVRSNGCNIWLVTHKRDTTEFYAYEITTSGISSAPVISHEGTFTGAICYAAGTIKCSHDRQKIASVCLQAGSMWGVELFDFNPATGIVSNCRVLESNPPGYPVYGAEFSPDNSKLYVTMGAAFQWDLSLPTTAAIIASKTAIAFTATTFGDMKLGPDGKIYVTKDGTRVLDCISIPNSAGTSCGYVSNSVNLSPNYCTLGLPNLIWATPSIGGQLTICNGTITTLTPSFSGGTWSSSNTGVATISPTGVVTAVAPGTSVISLVAGTSCDPVTTINVVTMPTLNGASLCIGNTTYLTASTGTGTWMSSGTSIATVGATTGLVTGVAAGTAVVTFSGPGCSPATTVVTVNAPSIAAEICFATTLTLSGTTPGGTWSSSNTAVAYVGLTSGIVTAVTSGTANISYFNGPQCPEISNVMVDTLFSPIIGPTTVSVGSSITLSNTTPGGTWSSGDTTKAKVNTTGKVTGVHSGTVTIYYTLPSGCKISLIINVLPNASVSEIGEPTRPTLHPNPATNEITIQTDPSTFTSFYIYNAVGQQISSHTIIELETKVDVKALPPGQYLVVFNSDKQREILRFTKW